MLSSFTMVLKNKQILAFGYSKHGPNMLVMFVALFSGVQDTVARQAEHGGRKGVAGSLATLPILLRLENNASKQ